MKEHHKYLVGKGKNADLSNVSIEKIEEIRKKTIEKDNQTKYICLGYIYFLQYAFLVLFLLGLLCYKLFF